MVSGPPHLPVLLQEVLQAFEPCALKTFVDGTVGAGGHATALLERYPTLELLIGIDQDPQARLLAEQRLAPFQGRYKLVAGNFRYIGTHLNQLGIEQVDGILLDLGVSSMQLDQAERGFSFQYDGPLDMRMDPTAPQSAADLVNTLSEAELTQILRDYGDLAQARQLASAIVAGRQQAPLTTTRQLVELLRPVARPIRGGRIHPLTLVFQALRIAVNQELQVLEAALPAAVAALRPGGRLAVITFHSKEDRIVKQWAREAAQDWTADPTNPYSGRQSVEPTVRLITKAVQATKAEQKHNPRSRSAKLRVVEKL
jgi:16S rRNA (cytosine1402-N4)-methyltransferase